MKQLIRKILKEQDEVINVPDLDFFDGDWEELLRFTKGRKFRIRGNLNLSKICPETLGNLVSVDGNLILYDCENLTSLGSLERVGGKLDLEYCHNLKSLGSLERVVSYLDLSFCENLTSLGSLEHVGENLYLINTPIADMYSEEEIREMVEVEGNIYLDEIYLE
jgi:hypothetical protein